MSLTDLNVIKTALGMARGETSCLIRLFGIEVSSFANVDERLFVQTAKFGRTLTLMLRSTLTFGRTLTLTKIPK